MSLPRRLHVLLTPLVFISASASAQSVLVGHYRLDETTGTMCTDSSGMNNHGTYVGGVTLGQAGAAAGSGMAVDFDGVSGRVEIPGSASLDALRDDLSVAAWIEADVVQLQRIFSNQRPSGGGSGGSWSFGTISNGLRFTTLDVQDYNINAPVACCMWHHVAVSFDASFTATFYLDGIAMGSVGGGQQSNAPGSSNQYLIGVLDLGAGPPEWFDGRIDDIQVYSGALSAADIQFLFTNPGATVSGMPGSSYCGPSVTNSAGQSATTTASGSAAAASNDVTLTADLLPQNSFGFFLTSQTQGFVMGPGGSQGNLCLGGAIGRYVGTGQIQNSGGAGTFDLVLDLTQAPTPTGLVQIQPGETWSFQCWYRDAVGGSATSNFTDGWAITFQ